MPDFQRHKAVVRAFHADLAAASPDTVAGVIARHTTPDWAWHGTYPFGKLRGAEAVAEAFWAPLMRGLKRIQRRPDIFFAGEAKGAPLGTWVVETGHLMGLLDEPWLSIQPTRRIAMLRYAEWNRVEEGRIAESTLFVDIPHLMWQTGQYPLPPQTGAHLVTPGPIGHDGLLHDAQDPVRGEATMRAVEALLGNSIPQHDPDEAGKLARVWHDDMIWWGPGGIGASYTIARYVEQHCKPFDDGLRHDGRAGDPLCRVAEGDFGGFFGWSNYYLRSTGGYLGMTAGAEAVAMPFIDIYRVQDGRLAENWVFIDILGFLADQGLDVLSRMPTTVR